MIKLFVENTNLHSPVAAIRWCVDRNSINKLKELVVVNPYMFFVIARERDGEFSEVDQRVVPLGQAMEYIEFYSPGNHRIFGCLVWNSGCYRKEKDARENLVSDLRNYRHLYTHLVNSGGSFKKPVYSHPDLDHGSVDVIVPDGYFAKEPTAWEKWWVNLWYESKPVNQCHFRRRRLLAYSIQPPVILTWILLKTLIMSGEILLLLLCGIRGIKFDALLRPFRYGIDWDCVPHNKTSVFLTDSSGKDRHPILFFFIPMVQLVILVFLGLVKWGLSWLGLSIGSTLLWLLAINVIVILGIFVVNMLGGLDKLFPEETKEQKAARRKLELERLYAEYQDMICSGLALQPSVSSLPSKRRTVYLRFQEFKSKVCLPFAR